LNRGMIYRLQNKRDAALADFSAVMAPPDDRRLVEAAYYRAQMYLEVNDADHALQDLSVLTAQRPEFAPGYLLRAQIYLARDAKPLGLEDLSSVLKISGESGEVLAQPRGIAQRGHLLRVMGAQWPAGAAKSALELAGNDLEQAIKLGQNNSDAWRDLGAVRESLGQPDAAVEAYGRALAINMNDVRTHIDRGWALQKLRRYKDARQDFIAVLETDPTNAEAQTGFGYVAACDQGYEEAREHAAAALIHGAGDYLILHNVACIYAEVSRTQPGHMAEAQELAVAALGRAVDLWHKSGSGPDEMDLIRVEPAFYPALRGREDFKKLVEAETKPSVTP
jgi:tetratricopeptide (TPR) repeat protein